MNTIKKVLVAGVTGTTFMTLFSDVVSKVKASNYNEAEILGELLNRITSLDKQQSRIAGYVGHYGMGQVFAAAYVAYLKKTNTRPNLINGALYGALSGVAGAFIWHSTFKAHPNPPCVDLKNYYKQLVLAHVIFGVSAALVLRKEDQ
jgi:hypothetical protein